MNVTFNFKCNNNIFFSIVPSINLDSHFETEGVYDLAGWEKKLYSFSTQFQFNGAELGCPALAHKRKMIERCYIYIRSHDRSRHISKP
jgi:hypothetical protein